MKQGKTSLQNAPVSYTSCGKICRGDFPEAVAKFFCERQSNIASEH